MKASLTLAALVFAAISAATPAPAPQVDNVGNWKIPRQIDHVVNWKDIHARRQVDNVGNWEDKFGRRQVDHVGNWEEPCP